MAATSTAGDDGRAWRHLPLLLPALALALHGAYLAAGFAGDDVIFLNLIRDGSAPPWWRGLWSESRLPCLTSLWWVQDLPPGGFWRPLPGLVLEASLFVFGERALPLHLLALLLHGASAALLALLAARLTASRRLGFLTGLLFVTCEDHSMVVGWVATLTDVLCGFFVALSLWAHLAWLERRRVTPLAVSLLALILAFACKESAVAAPLGLAGLTIVVHARRAREISPADGWIRTAARDRASWLPGLVLLALFLLAYRAFGFGVGASAYYADPGSEPAAFLGHLAAQVPVLWLATLSPAPPSAAVFFGAAQPLLLGLGLVLFGLFLMALRPLRRDPLAWWALLFYLAALAPQTGAEGGERALYLPLLPGAVLLALLAAQGGFLARRWLRAPPSASRLSRLGASWVFAAVLVPGIVLSPLYAVVFSASFRLPGRQVRSLVELVEATRPGHVVVCNTSGPFLTFYLRDELSWRVGRRVDTRVLSSLSGVMSVERTAERSITLRTDRRGWLTNGFALVARTSTKLAEGQSFPTDLFTATIVELAPGERMPDALAVRFDFKRSIEDPRILFATWTGESFVRLDTAALPPGAPHRLADTSDIWRGMF